MQYACKYTHMDNICIHTRTLTQVTASVFGWCSRIGAGCCDIDMYVCVYMRMFMLIIMYMDMYMHMYV